MKKRSTKTTAANLETRFDAAEEVLDYFDTAHPVVRHGGRRPGAGRPSLGKLRKTVKLSPQAVQRLNTFARRKGMDFSAAVEEASRAIGG